MSGVSKRIGRAAALAVAFVCLAVGLALPVRALAGGGDEWNTNQGQRAANWLLMQVPTPRPGDEETLVALVRSGLVDENSGPTQSYYEAYAQGSGVTLGAERSAWRALAVAACGRDLAADGAELLEALGDMDALLAGGTETVRLALLVYGGTGAPRPSGFDIFELARLLAATRNEDGGYGESGSTALHTARVVTALAPFAGDEAVATATAGGMDWLKRNQGDFGGYEENGAPSALATAEAVIAFATLGQAAEKSPSPLEALLLFQNEDGGFAADPDTAADVNLTAVCTLACAAAARAAAGMPAVLRLDDGTGLLAPGEAGQAAPDGTQDGGASQGAAGFEPPMLTLPFVGPVSALWVGLAALVLVIVLVVVLAVRGAKKQKARAAEGGKQKGTTANAQEAPKPAAAKTHTAAKPGGKATGKEKAAAKKTPTKAKAKKKDELIEIEEIEAEGTPAAEPGSMAERRERLKQARQQYQQFAEMLYPGQEKPARPTEAGVQTGRSGHLSPGEGTGLARTLDEVRAAMPAAEMAMGPEAQPQPPYEAVPPVQPQAAPLEGTAPPPQPVEAPMEYAQPAVEAQPYVQAGYAPAEYAPQEYAPAEYTPPTEVPPQALYATQPIYLPDAVQAPPQGQDPAYAPPREPPVQQAQPGQPAGPEGYTGTEAYTGAGPYAVPQTPPPQVPYGTAQFPAVAPQTTLQFAVPPATGPVLGQMTAPPTDTARFRSLEEAGTALTPRDARGEVMWDGVTPDELEVGPRPARHSMPQPQYRHTYRPPQAGGQGRSIYRKKD